MDSPDPELVVLDECAACEFRVTAFDVEGLMSRNGRLTAIWGHHCGAHGMTDLEKYEWDGAYDQMRALIREAEIDQSVKLFASQLENMDSDQLIGLFEFLGGLPNATCYVCGIEDEGPLAEELDLWICSETCLAAMQEHWHAR